MVESEFSAINHAEETIETFLEENPNLRRGFRAVDFWGWCKSRGVSTTNKNEFYQAFKDLGFKQVVVKDPARRSTRMWVRQGEVAQDPDNPQPDNLREVQEVPSGWPP